MKLESAIELLMGIINWIAPGGLVVRVSVNALEIFEKIDTTVSNERANQLSRWKVEADLWPLLVGFRPRSW